MLFSAKYQTTLGTQAALLSGMLGEFTAFQSQLSVITEGAAAITLDGGLTGLATEAGRGATIGYKLRLERGQYAERLAKEKIAASNARNYGKGSKGQTYEDYLYKRKAYVKNRRKYVDPD